MMMESGHLVDEVADVVQTQVIAHQARASIRNREEVPLYVQTEEDRPPVWMQNPAGRDRPCRTARHGLPLRE